MRKPVGTIASSYSCVSRRVAARIAATMHGLSQRNECFTYAFFVMHTGLLGPVRYICFQSKIMGLSPYFESRLFRGISRYFKSIMFELQEAGCEEEARLTGNQSPNG